MTNYNIELISGRACLCKIMNFNTKNVQEIVMKYVIEPDCTWRSIDDDSEFDEWNWQVFSVKSL